VVCGAAASLADERGAKLDVPFEPTHPRVVEAMLRLANVGKDDLVYDLGCGDGRIVIMAAQKFGARGLGVDIDPQRLKESRENAKHAGVADRVQFKQENIFRLDLSPATVVTMYLLNPVNLQLRPRLFADLKPGTRIVSHAFHMEDWEADQTLHHPKARNKLVYFWKIPAGVGGVWRWKQPADKGESPCQLELQQEFQVIRGTLTIKDKKPLAIIDGQMDGPQIQFAVMMPGEAKEKPTKVVFDGQVKGDTIEGTQTWHGGGAKPAKMPWEAKRQAVDLTGQWQITLEPGMEHLNGVLRIEHRQGRREVDYVLAKPKQEVPIAAFYAWGASVRFELPAQQQLWMFKGTLGQDSGAGKVLWETSTKEPAWSAKRLAAPAK